MGIPFLYIDMLIDTLKEKIFKGQSITKEEALELSLIKDKRALYEAAGEIRDHFVGNYFDTC